MSEAGAVAFTDGRHSVHDTQVLRRVMTYAREFDAVISCETRDKYLGANGVMNEGLLASWLGLSGIPKETEILPLERDLRIAGLTRSNYHAAMISVPESAEAIRLARSRGAKVTCGISINNLSLNENDIGEYRTFFKLYPPLRSEDDRVGHGRGARGRDDRHHRLLARSAGCRHQAPALCARPPTAPSAWKRCLRQPCGSITADRSACMRLIDALSTRPAQIFGLDAGTLKPGAKADITLIDLDEPWLVSRDMLLSRSKNTPFEDARFTGRAVATFVGGDLVYAID